MDELKAYEAYICHNEFSQDELPKKKDAIVKSTSHNEEDDWWDYAAKIECYMKEDADKVIADLEEKVEELTGELRIARPTFKCAECGEVGPHKWVWNGKEGADFVARRCCDKCIKEKGLTLWPKVHSCEEKCKEFNALKAENEKLRSCLKCLDYRDLIKDSPEKKSVKELMENLK